MCVLAILRAYLAYAIHAKHNLTSALASALQTSKSVTRKTMTCIALSRNKRVYTRYDRDIAANTTSNNNTRISQIVRALCVQNDDKSYSLASVDTILDRKCAMRYYIDCHDAFEARYAIVRKSFDSTEANYRFVDMLTDTRLHDMHEARNTAYYALSAI